MIQRHFLYHFIAQSYAFGNRRILNLAGYVLVISILLTGMDNLNADEGTVATILVEEDAGLSRIKEYITFSLQISSNCSTDSTISLIAEDAQNGEQIWCQTNDIQFLENELVFVNVVFPISIGSNMTKQYLLKRVTSLNPLDTDLRVNGENFDLFVENKFYRADLTKDPLVEPQSHDSGQIREMLIKMRFNQLLTNVEDRLHWAPNFKRPELEYYTTIAHWDSPDYYTVEKGPYLVRTVRADSAPDHPEIALTAVYKFYAAVPYFKFYSSMQFVADAWLELLRNDEITIDSMFTDMAFQRPQGDIVDIPFAERHDRLNKQPIENNCPWICFYNQDIGFAFGSIRIHYDNSNQFGESSPTYEPHTQIGEWLAGIKYWNRRLIHDHLSFVPKGSRYVEENAYLVFDVNKKNRFESIIYWAERLRQPVKVTIRWRQEGNKD